MSKALQHKLQQYAPPPPESAWDRLAHSLDEVPATTLGERLQAYEEVPPTANWNVIEKRLGGGVIRSMPTRKIIRYAAAAAILGLVIFSGIRFLDSSSSGPDVITRETASPARPATAPEQHIADHNSPVQGIAANTEARAIKTRTGIKTRNNSRILSANSLAARGLMQHFIPQRAEPKPVIATKPGADKYMVYSDDLGNAVKLPKKLFDFFACVAEDISCKKQMQSLQQKFAATGFTTDFTGVMEMLQGLKENQ